MWNMHQLKLEKYLNNRNIKHFRWWRVIRKTMVVIKPWILIKEIVELIGNLHQKYHLLMLTRNTDIDFRELETVVEIGGGYGAMCATIFDKGFNGRYVLYDLPEMQELSKYYLSKRKLKKDIFSTFSRYEIKGTNKPSLLIALWSLSEIPVNKRDKLDLTGFDYYLFAFQSKFTGVDNIKYFMKLKDKIGGSKWNMIKIEHVGGENYYLIRSKE